MCSGLCWFSISGGFLVFGVGVRWGFLCFWCSVRDFVWRWCFWNSVWFDVGLVFCLLTSGISILTLPIWGFCDFGSGSAFCGWCKAEFWWVWCFSGLVLFRVVLELWLFGCLSDFWLDLCLVGRVFSGVVILLFSGLGWVFMVDVRWVLWEISVSDAFLVGVNLEFGHFDLIWFACFRLDYWIWVNWTNWVLVLWVWIVAFE